MDIFQNSSIHLMGLWVVVSCLTGLLVFLVVKIFDLVFSNQSSSDRYHKSILALIFFFLLNFVVTYYLYDNNFQQSEDSISFHFSESNLEYNKPILNEAKADNQTVNTTGSMKSSFFSINWIFKLLGIFWLIGAVAYTFKMIGGYLYTKSLIKKNQEPIPHKWNQFILNRLRKLEIKKQIKVFESLKITSPLTFGFTRPIIAVPLGFFTTLPAEQIEAVLLHELYHIKHKDYLINLLTMTFEVIFFYHPLMWWLAKNIRNERENRCDDQVTQITDKQVYAHALLNVESYRQSMNYAIPFSNKQSNLKMRIMRIFEQKPERNIGLKPFLSLLMVVIFLMGFTFYKLEDPKNEAKQEGKITLREEPVEKMQKQTDDKVLFKSENTKIGLVLEMTKNTLIAKTKNDKVKLYIDEKLYPLNEKIPVGEQDIATMYENKKELSHHFFSRQYFESHNREKWDKENENRNTYIFDKKTEFFTFRPAKSQVSDMKKASNENTEDIIEIAADDSSSISRIQNKPFNTSSFEIYGPLVISSKDDSELIDSTNLELLKKLVKKHDSDENAEVVVKIDGKVLAEGANIKKALGVREIMKIKIVAPSKDAETGVIEIYTDAVLDAADIKRPDQDDLENTLSSEEDNTDSIQVYFESENLNYSGEVKYNAEKSSVLEALGFSDNDPLFVLDGKVVGSKFRISHINPNEIDRINVLKDKKAIDKYGDKATNGVVEIYLKQE